MGVAKKFFIIALVLVKIFLTKKFILCIIGKKIGGAYEKINKPIGCVDAC